METTPEMKN